jgi:hypothetical protein
MVVVVLLGASMAGGEEGKIRPTMVFLSKLDALPPHLEDKEAGAQGGRWTHLMCTRVMDTKSKEW